jgi:hypothetical protein
MNLKFVELHTPLFLGGINFQTKLDVSRKDGLKLKYDDYNKWVVVEYNGHKGYLPLSSVSVMVEMSTSLSGTQDAVKPTVLPAGKVKAQASTPAGIRNED